MLSGLIFIRSFLLGTQSEGRWLTTLPSPLKPDPRDQEEKKATPSLPSPRTGSRACTKVTLFSVDLFLWPLEYSWYSGSFLGFLNARLVGILNGGPGFCFYLPMDIEGVWEILGGGDIRYAVEGRSLKTIFICVLEPVKCVSLNWWESVICTNILDFR